MGDALKNLEFVDGVASHHEGKYYASLQAGGSWGLYVYDLKRTIWTKEDALHLVDMVYGDGELYCVDEKGNLFAVTGKRQEVISWYPGERRFTGGDD